jgi:hypothetical protein
MAQFFNLDSEGREFWQRLRAGGQVEAEAARFANAASAPLGLTLLHVAVRRGDEQIAARLLAAGARVDAVTEDGDTPLMDAARHSDVSCLKLLLGAGASVSAVNKQGQSALFSAVLRETLVCEANLKNCAHDAVKLLLRARADPNVGRSPLYIAANSSLCATARLLLAAGADPNARYELSPAKTASVLEGAIRLNVNLIPTDVIEKLLVRGARPCGADVHAVIDSPRSWMKHVLVQLLAAGAPLEGESSIAYCFTLTMFRDEAGEVHTQVVRLAVSPLDYALVTGRVAAAAELLAWGARAAHPDALVVLRNSRKAAAKAVRLIDARVPFLRLAGTARRAAAAAAMAENLWSGVRRSPVKKSTWVYAGYHAALAATARASLKDEALVMKLIRAAAQAAGANRLADEFIARGLTGLVHELRRAKPGVALALSAVYLANSAVLREYASRRNAAANEMERRAEELLARLPAARVYAASFL